MILSQVLCEALSADVHPSGVLMVLSEMVGYLGRYRSQVPQEGPGNASRGLLFSEGRGHSAVTSCQLQQENVIHHAPVNEQNIDLFAKLFSRHPSISKLYLLVFLFVDK